MTTMNALTRRLVPLTPLTSLLILSACAGPREPSAGPEVGVTIRDVVEDTATYVGRPVTVSGRLRYIRSPGVFVIGPRSDVLVVSSIPAGRMPALDDGDVVRVRGVVRRFNRPDFDPYLGPYLGSDAVGFVGPGIGPDFYSGWDGRPAIIADSVERLRSPAS